MQSCDDYIKCKINLVLLRCNSRFEFQETKVISRTYPQYSMRIYKSDVTEWLPPWPENLKQSENMMDICIEKAFTKGLTIFTGTFLCCLSLG